MASDPRDQIWEAVFDTYYSIYFEEMASDALVSRWQLLDESTKIVVALTATGSAVAGWTLWQDAEWKWLWTLIAGTGAILSIIHSALGVPGRLKGHSDNRRLFSALRIDLETFRYRMQVDTQFPIEEFTEELVEFRKRFGLAIDRVRDDVLLTDSLRSKTQTELDERLGNKVIQL